MPKKGQKRAKLPSIKSLKNKAWELQSICVRKSAANFQGLTECYTCYRLFPWMELHSGHYKHNSYDFDLRNIHPQCPRCNTYLHGQPDEYYVHLIKDYGQEVADELRTRKHWNDYKRAELVELIKKYKEWISKL